MRTPDTPAFRLLKQERRHLATLLAGFGGLDNRWVAGMLRRCEDTIARLEWQVLEDRRAARQTKQRRADAKRRAPEWRDY